MATNKVSFISSHLHLKGQTQNRTFLLTLKILTCYINITVGYFDLKLHIHTDLFYMSNSNNTRPLMNIVT